MFSHRTRCLPLIAALMASAPVPGHSQVGDSMAGISARSLQELIHALPGRPVDLETLVRSALDRNLSLESARMNRRLAEADVNVTGGLFDPVFSVGGRLASDPFLNDRSTQQLTAGIQKIFPLGTQVDLGLIETRSRLGGAPQSEPSTFGTDLSLGFSQPLLDGFNVRDTAFRIANIAQEAARHRWDRAIELLVADVETQYWALAEAEAVEAVFGRSLEIAQALLSRNEQLHARGLATEVDVLTARSGMALRRANLIEARRARLDAAETLLFLVHGAAAPRVLSAETLPLKTSGNLEEALDPPSVETAQAQALSTRSDLEATRIEVRGAEIAMGASRNARRPALSLEGAARTTGQGGTFGSGADGLAKDLAWSFGLSLSAPFGNRTDRGESQVARWNVSLRELIVSDTENSVRQDVRGALRAVSLGQERLASATEATQLAVEQLEAERQRLNLGLGDSFRLLETEENSVQAGLIAVRSRFDLNRAGTDYRLALGIIADPYRSGG